MYFLTSGIRSTIVSSSFLLKSFFTIGSTFFHPNVWYKTIVKAMAVLRCSTASPPTQFLITEVTCSQGSPSRCLSLMIIWASFSLKLQIKVLPNSSRVTKLFEENTKNVK